MLPLLSHGSYDPHLTTCLPEAIIYFGLHHMQRDTDLSSKPAGTEPHTKPPQHHRMLHQRRWEITVSRGWKSNHHPTQSDCKGGVETEHAWCPACAAVGLAGLAGIGEAGTSAHIWERLSIPASSSSNRGLASAVLLHSLVSISIPTYTLPCAIGKHTYSSAWCTDAGSQNEQVCPDGSVLKMGCNNS